MAVDPTPDRPTMIVFDGRPTYHTWCDANGLDPDDDDNRDRYAEWRGNQ